MRDNNLKIQPASQLIDYVDQTRYKTKHCHQFL